MPNPGVCIAQTIVSLWEGKKRLDPGEPVALLIGHQQASYPHNADQRSTRESRVCGASTIFAVPDFIIDAYESP